MKFEKKLKTKRREPIVEAAVRAASDYTVRNLNSPYVSRKPDGEVRNMRNKTKRPEVKQKIKEQRIKNNEQKETIGTYHYGIIVITHPKRKRK